MPPQVSVLMSVWNEARYLPGIWECLQAQTLKDYEVVVVDDGSTDTSGAILDDIARRDPRWRIVHQANTGLTVALNRGLRECRAKYIARHDADDWSLPSRFQRQVEFLDSHPDIGLLGTWAYIIDDPETALNEWRCPVTTLALRWFMCFDNPFAHSSVMYRKDQAQKMMGYDEDCRYAQDFNFWVKWACQTGVACLPDPLVKFYLRSTGISASHGEKQRFYHLRAVRKMMAYYLGWEPEEQAVATLLASSSPASGEAAGGIALLRQLYSSFLAKETSLPGDMNFAKRDMARRLWNLARPHARHPFAWRAMGTAAWMDPHYLRAFGTAVFRPPRTDAGI